MQITVKKAKQKRQRRCSLRKTLEGIMTRWTGEKRKKDFGPDTSYDKEIAQDNRIYKPILTNSNCTNIQNKPCATRKKSRILLQVKNYHQKYYGQQW